MGKKSTQIAIGGVFSALCLMLMFMTGLIPFATYALPALAGVMLVAVLVENGRKTAVLVYVSVSVLSLFIVPDREAAMMFVMLFGYYPIVKGSIQRIRARSLRVLVKLAVFNTAVVGGYMLFIHLFGMAELVDGMGDLGGYAAQILLVVGNITFLIYDYALTKYTAIYIHWFKPKFLRR